MSIENIQLKLTKHSPEADFARDTIVSFQKVFMDLQKVMSDLASFQKDIESKTQSQRAQFEKQELNLKRNALNIIRQASDLISANNLSAADPSVAVYKSYSKYDKQLLFSNDLTQIQDAETSEFVSLAKNYILDFLNEFEMVQKRIFTRQMLLTKLSESFTNNHLKSRRELHLAAKFGIGEILFPNKFDMSDEVYKRQLLNEKIKAERLEFTLPINTCFANFLLEHNIQFPDFGPFGVENVEWTEEQLQKAIQVIQKFGKYQKINGEKFVKQALIQEVQLSLKSEMCFISFGGSFQENMKQNGRKKFLTIDFDEYIGVIGEFKAVMWVSQLFFIIKIE